MKMIVCSVRDAVADMYGNPFYCVSTGMAVRSFTDMVNRSEDGNQMNLHPEDFALFELGTFDTDDATFTLLERPRQLLLGKDAVKKVN